MGQQVLELEVPRSNFSEVEEFYLLYSKGAYGLALKLLKNKEAAEDATQEAFLRYCRNQTNYDPGKGTFYTWLLKVVYHICIDQLRRNSNRYPIYLEQLQAKKYLDALADKNITTEEQTWLKMQQVIVKEALNTLSVQQRELIELAFFKKFTHSDIAFTTGLPLGTVKSTIRQGLLKLRGPLGHISQEYI